MVCLAMICNLVALPASCLQMDIERASRLSEESESIEHIEVNNLVVASSGKQRGQWTMNAT